MSASDPGPEPLSPLADPHAARLPAEFVQRLAAILPPAHHAIAWASFAVAKAPALWLNPLVADPADTRAALAALAAQHPGASLTPLRDDALLAHAFPPDVLSRSPSVTSGAAYLISPSSLLPPAALDPGPDDDVLDLCAAPGGKTLQLAARIAGPADAPKGRGHLAAVEAVKPRFFKLQGVLSRFGALARPGVRLFLKDGRSVGHAVPERFDKILLDAPCSSEARFDADDPDSFSHWSPHKVAECAYKQKALLHSALMALRVGGTMVYCTCSFSPEENERVVLDVLDELEGRVVTVPMTLPPMTPAPALQAGLFGLDHALRVLPDDTWDGFFLVRLEKREASPASPRADRHSSREKPHGRGVERARRR
jgi:16S rRNA (cytosine1407-C5)-methyltransferase